MANLVVFDSQFGSTQKIAEVIADELGAKTQKLESGKVINTKGSRLLIIGSPTWGGRPTPATMEFLDSLTGSKEVTVAVFDTRMDMNKQNTALKMIMKIIGFAGDKMAKAIKNKGFNLIEPVGGFIVLDKEGPLAEGELERAKDWAGLLK